MRISTREKCIDRALDLPAVRIEAHHIRTLAEINNFPRKTASLNSISKFTESFDFPFGVCCVCAATVYRGNWKLCFPIRLGFRLNPKGFQVYQTDRDTFEANRNDDNNNYGEFNNICVSCSARKNKPLKFLSLFPHELYGNGSSRSWTSTVHTHRRMYRISRRNSTRKILILIFN